MSEESLSVRPELRRKTGIAALVLLVLLALPTVVSAALFFAGYSSGVQLFNLILIDVIVGIPALFAVRWGLPTLDVFNRQQNRGD